MKTIYEYKERKIIEQDNGTIEIYMGVEDYINSYLPLRFRKFRDNLIAHCKMNDNLSQKVYLWLQSKGAIKPMILKRWYKK